MWLSGGTCLAEYDFGHRVSVDTDLFYLVPCLGLDARAALDLGRQKEAGLDPINLAEQMRYVETQPRPDFLRTDVPWEIVQHFFARMREDVLRLVEPRSS